MKDGAKKIKEPSPMSRETGFTLIEVVIATSIVAILIGALYGLFEGYGRLRSYGEAQIITVEQARDAMDAIEKYVSQAHRVLASQTVNGQPYVSSTSTLVLQLPAVNASQDIVNGAWDYVVFFQSGSNFFRSLQPNASSVRPAGQKLMSDSVAGAVFTYDNIDFDQVRTVTVQIDVQRVVRQRTVSSNTSGLIELKNY
jgi:prepilin-type N-terminal cleavage/methylation domain-containing protein